MGAPHPHGGVYAGLYGCSAINRPELVEPLCDMLKLQLQHVQLVRGTALWPQYSFVWGLVPGCHKWVLWRCKNP